MIRASIFVIALIVFSAVPSVMVSPFVGAAPVQSFGDRDSRGLGCSRSFLGFPAWFDHLPRKSGTCDVAIPDGSNHSNLSKFIFTIVLNLIEIGLRLVGFAAVGFIIYGGFKYLTSAGSGDRITSGRKIIQNAVIGLVISFFSVAIVNLVASNL